LDWIELDWIELDWIELDWIELDWIELDLLYQAMHRLNARIQGNMTTDIDHDTIVIAVANKGGGDVGTSVMGSKAGVDVAAADAGMPSGEDRGTDG